MEQQEICFDTETTGIDANDAELVGLSFSWKAGRSLLYSLSGGQEKPKRSLFFLHPVFENEKSLDWTEYQI